LATQTLEARFRAMVEKTGPLWNGSSCWIWRGAKDNVNDGYGVIRSGGGRKLSRTQKAHRVSYELLVGPIAAGLEIDHLCRVRACVNPAHLEPVTRAENNRRGKSSQVLSDFWRLKTHCLRGHPFDDANTYVTRAGRRHCRACTALSGRKRRQRQHGSWKQARCECVCGRSGCVSTMPGSRGASGVDVLGEVGP